MSMSPTIKMWRDRIRNLVGTNEAKHPAHAEYLNGRVESEPRVNNSETNYLHVMVGAVVLMMVGYAAVVSPIKNALYDEKGEFRFRVYSIHDPVDKDYLASKLVELSGDQRVCFRDAMTYRLEADSKTGATTTVGNALEIHAKCKKKPDTRQLDLAKDLRDMK